MSDTESRSPSSVAQKIADSLLRTLRGTSASLRVTTAATTSNMSELGIISTTFVEVVISPVVMRKLRPTSQADGNMRWELLASATSIEEQVMELSYTSAKALLQSVLAVTVGGVDYSIASIAVNEANGRPYMYRMEIRQCGDEGI